MLCAVGGSGDMRPTMLPLACKILSLVEVVVDFVLVLFVLFGAESNSQWALRVLPLAVVL